MNVKKYRKFLEILLISLIVVNPFIFWPFSGVAFEVPKVWFVNRVIELIGITALLFSFTLRRPRRKNMAILSVFIFYIIAVACSFWGVDFSKSLIGNYYRADGLITLTHFLVLFLFLFLYFEKSWLRNIFEAIAFSNLALSIWVCINYLLELTGRPVFESWDGAVGVNFGNPNFLAGYLLVTLPFSYYIFEKRKGIIFKLPLIFQLIAIALTQSWAGVIGAAFYISYLLFGRFRKYKIIALIFMGLVIIGVWFGNSYQRTYEEGVLVAESRERIITKGLLAFAQRPILGWGWANFDYAFDAVDWPLKINDDVYVDKAHTAFLEILVTTGIVGLITYIVLLYTVARNLFFSKSSYRNYLIAVFVLYVFHTQTNITSISEELIFWALVGISAKVSG